MTRGIVGDKVVGEAPPVIEKRGSVAHWIELWAIVEEGAILGYLRPGDELGPRDKFASSNDVSRGKLGV